MDNHSILIKIERDFNISIHKIGRFFQQKNIQKTEEKREDLFMGGSQKRF